MIIQYCLELVQHVSYEFNVFNFNYNYNRNNNSSSSIIEFISTKILEVNKEGLHITFIEEF